MSDPIRILCVCGARPNFMKVAPIVSALERTANVDYRLVHTGQHYDDRMSDRFFHDLGLPTPDVNLNVGSGSHAEQTATVMLRFEPVCRDVRPDWVIVVGDVNSTLACALVTTKLGIKVAHVEAGLRSFDRTMPEEINRILTDAISDALFVSEPSGLVNLKREGVAEDKIHLVGNVMIDSLLRCRDLANESPILSQLELRAPYAVVTLHRPANVDDDSALRSIIEALLAIAEDMPVVFPIHPRSRKQLAAVGLELSLNRTGNLRLIDPLGYFDFLKLMAKASLVLTDSGGIQEETTVLKVPCLTLRNNTERPITVTHGTNRLAGTRAETILRAYDDWKRRRPARPDPPPLWDGHAAERIVARLVCAGSSGSVTSAATGDVPPLSTVADKTELRI